MPVCMFPGHFLLLMYSYVIRSLVIKLCGLSAVYQMMFSNDPIARPGENYLGLQFDPDIVTQVDATSRTDRE